MGTINYKTNDYITLTTAEYDYANQCTEYETYDKWYDAIDPLLDEMYYEANDIIGSYRFDYINVYIESGYYEGFQIMFDVEELIWVDNDYRISLRNDIAALKRLLRELADIGLVATYPSWCIHFDSYHFTLKAIDEAIDKMWKWAKQIPTINTKGTIYEGV